ncbi:MAG: hypothetical protein J6Y33_03070 [Prevotella sp.]|nr:hypothetical protein [Prevotella sp.]
MKRRIYYGLAKMRRWANTPKGERIIVGTFSVMTVVLVFDVAMLICGCIMK